MHDETCHLKLRSSNVQAATTIRTVMGSQAGHLALGHHEPPPAVRHPRGGRSQATGRRDPAIEGVPVTIEP